MLYCEKPDPWTSRPRTLGSATVRMPESRIPHVYGASNGTGIGVEGRKDAKVFVTTLNCGGMKDVGDLGGDLAEWIPEGYDVYCIGLQECLALRIFR